jgi:hypothetical protein
MRWLRISPLGVVVTMLSCGGSAPGGPVAPSATTAPSPPPRAPLPPPTTRLLTGVVTDGDDGTPVANATVTQPFPPSSPAITDGAGSYVLSTTLATGDVGTFVFISKPGYDDTHGWADGRADGRHDFRLYRPVTVTAGESAHVAITADSSMCGFDFEYRCRLVHVRVPSSGTLILQTAADNSASPLWLLIGSDVVQYPVQAVTHLESSATAGAVVTVLIFRPWNPAPNDTGTLRTALLLN